MTASQKNNGANSSPSLRKAPASFLANPAATKEVLRCEGISLTHALGQNFLISDATIQRILCVAHLDPQDTVVEIGPGIGTLTVALLPCVRRLIAIERDASLVPALEQNIEKVLAGDAEKFNLLMGDALAVNYAQLAQRLARADTPITKLVANLPYQIAASVVLEIFQNVSSLSSATVMVQKEVAERMCAAPGSKIYGAYTVKLSLWAAVDSEFFVSRNNFLPAPHVDSAVVHLVATPHSSLAQTLTQEERHRVCRFVDAAFSQRRKKMVNALGSSGFDKEKVLQAMARLDLDPALRAEKLTTDDFIRLCAQVEDWARTLQS